MSSALFLATGWDAALGGINAFNRDLVTHCGDLCEGKYVISCVVLDVSAEEITAAKARGVNLFSLKNAGFSEFTQDAVPAIADIFRGQPTHPKFVVGHDIFTGALAIALSAALNAQSVVFIHTDYSSFKSLQDGCFAVNAHEREDIQATLIRTANFVMGIGPRLTEYARDLDGTDDKKRIRSFVPGLPEIDRKRAPKKFSGITFGRYDERNQLIKQHKLSVEAFLHFATQEEQDLTEKTLTVIGLSSEKEAHARQVREVLDIMEQYGAATNISCREFMPRNEIWEKLRGSTFSLMLSWREGFGLAGWEAIAAGVPVIISRKSGLFRFLDEVYDPYGNCFYSVEVRGTPTGAVNSADVEEASSQIRRLYLERDRLRNRARVFLSILKQRFTWSKRARAFLKRLDPKAFDFSHRANRVGKNATEDDVENSIDMEV